MMVEKRDKAKSAQLRTQFPRMTIGATDFEQLQAAGAIGQKTTKKERDKGDKSKS